MMASLMALDDIQLRRIESAIAEIESGSFAEQARKCLLLAALRKEKEEILQCRRRAGWQHKLAA